MPIIRVCLDCQDRKVGCHSTCEGYLKAVESYQKIKSKKEREAKESYDYAIVRLTRKRGK